MNIPFNKSKCSFREKGSLALQIFPAIMSITPSASLTGALSIRDGLPHLASAALYLPAVHPDCKTIPNAITPHRLWRCRSASNDYSISYLCPSGRSTTSFSLLPYSFPENHLMITCCGQNELIRASLLINQKPIVGHARDMALLMPHPVPVQGMILVKRPWINIGRNPINEINQKRQIIVPPLEKLQVALESRRVTLLPHARQSRMRSSVLSNHFAGRVPSRISFPSRRASLTSGRKSSYP